MNFNTVCESLRALPALGCHDGIMHYTSLHVSKIIEVSNYGHRNLFFLAQNPKPLLWNFVKFYLEEWYMSRIPYWEKAYLKTQDKPGYPKKHITKLNLKKTECAGRNTDTSVVWNVWNCCVMDDHGVVHLIESYCISTSLVLCGPHSSLTRGNFPSFQVDYTELAYLANGSCGVDFKGAEVEAPVGLNHSLVTAKTN